MQRINFRRIFTLAGFAALIVLYPVLWVRMINSPSERTGSDFISAYTGGRVADLWGAANVYDLEYQQQVQEQVVGFDLVPGQVLMFNHPPYLVPLLMFLMNGNYVASLVRYALVMAALYGVALWVAWKLLLVNGWQHRDAFLALAGMATFYPLFVSLLNTQDTAILVLGGLLWLFGLLTGRDWLAGLGLALMTVRPHIAVLLAIPFMFRRRKMFYWFCVGATLLGIFSFLLLGWDGVQSFLGLLLVSAGGNFYGMNESAMVNLVGILTRIFGTGQSEIIHWIGWGGYLTTIVVLCIVWVRNRILDVRYFGLAVIVSVFFAPHLHYHDLTLLIIPLIIIIIHPTQELTRWVNVFPLIPLIVSFAFLFSGFSPFFKYNFPILLMIGMVLMIFFPTKLLRIGNRG